MSDVVDELKREAKRKRNNVRTNGLGHPYVKFMEDDAIERIATLEQELKTAQAFIHLVVQERDKLREALEETERNE